LKTKAGGHLVSFQPFDFAAAHAFFLCAARFQNNYQRQKCPTYPEKYHVNVRKATDKSEESKGNPSHG
jgi:hypothetical protein